MPWMPELFSAPALERVMEQRRREELAAVPYFAGLMAGETDALVRSFAGEPELHHPVRGDPYRSTTRHSFFEWGPAHLRDQHFSLTSDPRDGGGERPDDN